MHASFNRFISALTKADQASLLRGSRIIELHAGDVLSSPNQISDKIFFPIRGSIALYIGNSSFSDPAHGMAVALIGSEGAAGLQLALGLGHSPFQLLVQSSGEAYVVDAAIAQKLVLRRSQVLLKFSKYLWTVYEEIANLTVKAFNKDIKIRLANWLLLSQKKCSPEALFMTHLHMAKMLGVRRASISIAARDMKLKRYIHYTRGQINLSNVPALERLSDS